MTGEVQYVLEVKEDRYEGQSRGGYLSSVLPLVQSWTSIKKYNTPRTRKSNPDSPGIVICLY